MRPDSPAAAILMGHLGLAQRTAAEVQDLYSRPAATPGAQGSTAGLGQG
jgi:hypothetical protein